MTAWNGREPHTRRHRSERLVMDRLGRRYRQAEPFHYSPDGPSLAELGLGVVVLLIWVAAIFWAIPVLAMAVMR